MVSATVKHDIHDGLRNGKDLKYATISIQDIVKKDCRMEASVYDIEGKHAREKLMEGIYPIVSLCGDNGLAEAYYRPRFKKIYVEKSDLPIYLPSQVSEIYPKPYVYMSRSTQTDMDALRVKKGQVLLTRSGTVGNCAYVSNTLNNLIVSDDLIRIETIKENAGYIYAYLKTKIGRTIVKTTGYGAVIEHIEPKHLNDVIIPNPPSKLKRKIHKLIEKAFNQIDESNKLIDEAQALLKEEFHLPDIEQIQKRTPKFDKSATFHNYSVQLGQMDNRLDGSYHLPTYKKIENHLRKHAKEVINVGDSRISKFIILPGRFKRVYVTEESGGVKFIGGKQILDLDPNNKKFLSLSHHADRIKNQLTLSENMTLITCSGTIGKVNIVPEHWNGWTANQHIIRVVPANGNIAGYLYAWLSSIYAYPLIKRYTYGAVVDEIDDKQISKITVPLCQNEDTQNEINLLIMRANKMRYQSYVLEQKAVSIVNDEVINTKRQKKNYNE